ncbi:hypothetical protein NCAS_0F01210 [Naumovozyma castellii]|uniref:Uncharacterized protein n=1 Tax=Naumovozyma castellii TaxID=27288 RepID=G0VGI4_NAUCA|nr:hypothetical protein NCAS_0F01210 [Naumovozyma castellii CBS 4309]CCC70605.1 hypothetical protein NCAS_0F01210 [Naumovozyma castellii CBS 4309]
MSTLLQLLSTYYKSVIESERIYNEYQLSANVQHIPNNKNGSSSSTSISTDSRIVDETLLLQKQLTQLTSQLQKLTQENETLKEVQKSNKALAETKIQNYKKRINILVQRENGKNTEKDEDQKKPVLHLFSPLRKRGLDETKGRIKNKNGSGLRDVISTGKHTLFDDDEDEDENDDDTSPNRSEDVLFLQSLNPSSKGKNNKRRKLKLSRKKIEQLDPQDQ